MTETKQKWATATLGLYTSFGCLSGVIHFGSAYTLKIRNSMEFHESCGTWPWHDSNDPGTATKCNQSGSPLPLQRAALPVARDPECPSKWRCQQEKLHLKHTCTEVKKKTWINQDSEKKKKSHSLQIPNKHSTTFQTHPTKSLNTRRSRICRTSAHRFRADNSAPQSSCSGGGNREAYLQVMEYKVSPVSC